MMIESKEKIERLKEVITRWAKHTHAIRELRSGDIPSLAYQIIEEFYHVKLSCGHYVRSSEEGVNLKFKDYDGEVYGTYCTDCAEEYKTKLNAKVIT